MNSTTLSAVFPGPIRLESGANLPSVTVAYETYGDLNPERNNAVLVCHALTGSAHAWGPSSDPGWWEGVIGAGKGLDPGRHFVVCSNFLGGCYGTTGPTSIDPSTGRRYGPEFPQMSVRDMVMVQTLLMDHLGIRRLACVIGGSLGGMQALEWAAGFPERVDSVIAIGCGLRHSAWAIGLNEVARQAILQDPAWQEGMYDRQPSRGLGLARMVAMLSYRSPRSFEGKFGRAIRSGTDPALFEVESYLHYQGEKLVQRFDANTYLGITRAMDGHDLVRGREGLRGSLKKSPVRCLAIGVDSDLLYPTYEQREVAEIFGRGRYAEIASPHGHDAFLIEYDQLNPLVAQFLNV
jgi:homoserine O-acetyltransferase